MDLGYRFLLSVLMLSRKPQRVAVVYGKPDYDENSLLLALALTECYAGRVVLLCQDPGATRHYLETLQTERGSAEKVTVHRRTVSSSLAQVSSAELFLFTIPNYAAPRPRRGRVHVNVWHGVGPKATAMENYQVRVNVPYLCGPAPTWMHALARGLRMPKSTQFLTGYPRQDLMNRARGTRHAELTQLGIDPARPFVVWMPTFRESVRTTIGAMNDGQKLSSHGTLRQLHRLFSKFAAQYDVQIVVKPHPLDSEDFDEIGLPRLSSEAIWGVGISTYEFLGLSSGLISDYSSVWVDYLQTLRPIALYCPDLEAYERSRGFNEPSLTTIAGGLLMKTEGDLHDFLHAVANDHEFRHAELRDVRAKLGFRTTPDRTHALMQELQVFAPAIFADR